MVDGRSVLVTGGASGIGEGIVDSMACAGARVAIFDRDRERLEQVSSRVRASGADVIALRGDVTSSEDADDAVKRTIDAFGSIDILVNCAGIIAPATPINEMSDEQFDRVVDVNLRGQFVFARAAVTSMKEAMHGRIVSIASRSWLGGAGIAQYAASKAAVVGFTRSLALELGRFGITANCVSPSVVDTPLFRAMPPEEQEEDLAKAMRHPIPRLATVADVANVVLFFASDESGYVTGQHVYVAGGADLLTSGTS